MSIDIPESVTSLRKDCFSGCSSLKTISMPSSLTSLEEGCFAYCSSLKTVICEIPTPISGNFFTGTPIDQASLYVPETSWDSYMKEAPWVEFKTIITDEKEYNAEDGFEFVFDNEAKTAELINYKGSENDVIIPKNVKYNGETYRVTSLGDMCFWGKSRYLTSIYIPSSVTSLGDGCFQHCTSLTSINIPNSVKNINQECFWNCSSLMSIYIPSSVESLGGDCFADCSSLKSIYISYSVRDIRERSGIGVNCPSLERIIVSNRNPNYDSRDNCNAIIQTEFHTMIIGCKNTVIPSSVTTLGGWCFEKCTALTSIDIPSSVTCLQTQCFLGCTYLTSIDIPSSVTRLGYRCFEGCSSLKSITVDKNNKIYDSRENCNAIIETETNKMVAGFKTTIIPESVTSLGDDCFYGCSSLTSIEIPTSVTSLGDGCFYDCSSLSSIVIPSSVTSLGEKCFSGCHSLTSIEIPTSVTSLGENCFSGCHSLTSIEIPISVTSLGDECFDNCSSLTSIEIPSSVTSLGQDCFNACSALESITVDKNNKIYDSREDCNAIIETSTNRMLRGCKSTVIPSSVTSLEQDCFSFCSSLKSITIPSSVTSLGYGCFYGCSSLISIEIPSSVTSLGERCFNSCSSLKTFTCAIPTAIEGDFFNYTINQATLYVPKASLDSYKSTYPWSRFGTILPIEPLKITVDNDTKEAVVETAKFVEDGEIVIPSSVEVEGVTYTVTNIANEAFKDVDDVETVTLPRTLKEIGDGAFAGCKALKEVVVSEAATSSKMSAVRYGKIQRVATRAAGYGMRIGERAFADCPVLAAVTIPATATTIGDNVFNNCESLKNVNCEAVNCPAVNTFGEFPISEATLIVPVGSLSQYSTTNPWSLFGKIQESDGTTGISSVSAHDGNDVKAVYGIDGSKRTASAKGLNIIRMNDGTTMKVMR